MAKRSSVSPELHDEVIYRDGQCFLYRLNHSHVCRDRWGEAHAASEGMRLTVDHVNDGGGKMGKRAPSDLAHLVAMCWAGNVGGPSRADRQAERAYLAALYPAGLSPALP